MQTHGAMGSGSAYEPLTIREEVTEAGHCCAWGFIGELWAWSSIFRLCLQLCCQRRAYSKVTPLKFLRGLINMVHEKMTSQGIFAEQVVEDIAGPGSFRALLGRVAIITGASNGIGLETARCLMKYGCHVVWAVRNPDKARNILRKWEASGAGLSGKSTIIKVDLNDLATIKPFVQEFLRLGLPLNYLILNAALMSPPKWQASAQGHESMFSVNNLGHTLMTDMLMGKMEETARYTRDVRIVVVSSLLATMVSDPDPDQVPGQRETYHSFADYCVSKAVSALFVQSLQEDLRGTGIRATAVHPGFVGTGLARENYLLMNTCFQSAAMHPFRTSVAEAAATTLYCALSAEIPVQIDRGYYFWYNCRPQVPYGFLRCRSELRHAFKRKQYGLIKPFLDEGQTEVDQPENAKESISKLRAFASAD